MFSGGVRRLLHCGCRHHRFPGLRQHLLHCCGRSRHHHENLRLKVHCTLVLSCADWERCNEERCSSVHCTLVHCKLARCSGERCTRESYNSSPREAHSLRSLRSAGQ
jgi:hypothetical protein